LVNHLTPEQAVNRILRDVRQRGDAALREWSEHLDGTAPCKPSELPADQLEAILWI
jgi:histidinol dehydrogenase